MSSYVGPGGNWVTVADVPATGSAPVANYTNLTATGIVVGRPAVFLGWEVTTAMSAAVTTIYDNASAASGTILAVIPASAAVGGYKLPVGIKAVNGIFASFAGTGTVNFLWQ